MIVGDLSTQPRCGLSEKYFLERDCWVDCRVPDCLWIDPSVVLGFGVNIVVMSHDIRPGKGFAWYARLCRIDADVFVAGFCSLYNCWIGEGAVVALGSVVRSQHVEPRTMVAGNPARVIARLVGGDWVKEAGGII